jgi:hypothetical protein
MIPFQIKIQDKGSSPQQKSRKAGVDIILVIGQKPKSLNKEKFVGIISHILNNASFDIDRVVLCKFAQGDSKGKNGFLVAGYVFVNQKSIDLIVKILRNEGEEWGVRDGDLRRVLYNC